jgi:hypothetical protein
VDTFPLQNVGVHVIKVWSAFSLTQEYSLLAGRYGTYPPAKENCAPSNQIYNYFFFS